MSKGEVRFRFGVRIPLVPNALTAVGYTSEKTYKSLEMTADALKLILTGLGGKFAEIGDRIFVERA